MNNINNESEMTPWHKERYVWMLIFFPLLAVIGGVITTYLAINSNDGLVVDDYYKEGLEINRTIERDQVAINYGLNAEVNFYREFEEVEVILIANSNFVHPANLSVTFSHATRSGLDKEAKVILTNNNVYRGNLSQLNSGKWYVHIQRNDWRLIKTILVN